MYLFLTTMVFVFSNSFFYLFWWSKVEGQFNTSDVGIFVILLTGPYVFLASKGKKILRNPFTIFFLFHLLFCAFHIFYVGIRFKYPFLQAAIASRSYLYYFSFFYFLLLLDTPEKVERTMNVLNWMAFVILIFSIVNYFGPVLFHHEWAYGHYERGGVKRAFIPGMPLVSMMAIWSFANTFSRGLANLSWNIKSLVLLAAHMFRQSRMRLFGVLVCLLAMAIYKRNVFKAAGAVLLVVVAGWVVTVGLNVNIFEKDVELTVDEVRESEGTYGGRIEFIKEAFRALAKSPIVGTGGSAIRAYSGAYKGISKQKYHEMWVLGKQSDIGIFNWIKNFGLVGLIWILFFGYFMVKYAWRARRRHPKRESLVLYSIFFAVFLVVTSPTHEHLINAALIPPVMLLCAVLVRLNHGWRESG